MSAATTTTPFGRREPAEGARPVDGEYAARLAVEERKSIGELLRGLVDESRMLVRQEVELAKAETRETIGVIGRNLAGLGVGVAVGLAAILALAAALNRGLTVLLANVVDPEVAVWLAPLLLGILFAAISAALINKAIKAISRQRLVPGRTLETLREDKEWLQRKIG